MTTNLFTKFETDPKLEKDGVWFEVFDGVKFLVARAGGANKRYEAAMETARKPYVRQFARGTMDLSKWADIMRQVFVDTLILDWEGVVDRDGTPMEFTKGNALKLFNALPDLCDQLMEESQNMSRYLVDTAEAVGESSADTMIG